MTEAGRHRLVRLGLASVLAGGAVLRFWNLASGLPYRIGVDEPVIAERAVFIVKSGDFNPHFFDYPGLYIYFQALVAWIRYLVGAMNGTWRSVQELYPEHLFLWTRLLNATLGTLTLYVVYRAGARWGQRVALLAAALLAVWSNHVRESHFALTDVPLTFLTTLAFLLSLRAYEAPRMAWFLAAGASVGLAAATKYGGAVAIVIPLLAALTASGLAPAERVRRAAAAAGAAALAYAAGAPYTYLDLPAFRDGFGKLMTFYQPRPLATGADIYIGHLKVAVGWVGLIVLAFGFAVGATRAIRDRGTGKWPLLLVFPLAYFYVIATKQLIFGRYLLPIVPFLCVLMAIAIVDVVDRLRLLHRPQWLRPVAATAFVALAIFHTAREGVVWPREHARRTTQDVAYRMVRQFIPERSGVAVERSVLRLPDSSYRTIDVRRLPDRTPEEYASMKITFVIASSDEFGPVYAKPDADPDLYLAYRRLFEERSECLPAIVPTQRVPGPEIRICRIVGP